MSGAGPFPPSLDEIAAMAQAAFEALPPDIRRLAGDVLIRIEDFPDEGVLDAMEMDDPFGLTGLYQGVDLTRQSLSDPTPSHPIVFLYRRPILDEWAERGDVGLNTLVSHVLVHEIGHHFGLDDDQIDALLAAEED